MMILAMLLAVQDAPNVVVIYADDLGWGDLGCYGAPSIRTPHLDRMAAEGQRWTDFYSAAPVCTPSRAALLTGRLPPRNGMASNKRRVLFPNSKGGLPASETTLPEALKAKGYATACVGKWHLGHLPEFLPTRQGFDAYFGIPYSNDMDRAGGLPPGQGIFRDPKSEYWNVPLLRGEKEVERAPDQALLTKRYTEEAVGFIRTNKAKPFFLYLAYAMPHVPLFASPEYRGKSPRGLYGDVVEELDGSVGTLLKTLRDEGLERRTLVVFSSDNGPWLPYADHGGSAGPLREGKGSTWEGGMRVPGIFWWPGKIAPGVVREIGCTMDVFATAVKLAGGEPGDVDGVDQSAVLFGRGPGARDVMYYHRDETLFALRKGRWKLHLLTQAGYGEPKAVSHDPPLLFDLGVDPGEKWNAAAKHPEVVDDLLKLAAAHRAALQPVENQLER